MMWYLNPKNIALLVLAVAVAALGIMFLFERIYISNIKAEQAKIEADYIIQSAALDDLKNNINAIEKLKARVQVINDNTARIRASVVHPGGTNEDNIKAANLISDYFNNGMLDKTSDGSVISKVLPGSGKADTPKSQ